MPIWTVEGADKATGKDVVVSIDAPTQELACSKAQGRNILVASIHQSEVDRERPKPVAYFNNSPQSRGAAGNAVPEYRGIVTGANVLDIVGTVSIVIGCIVMAGGLVLLVLMLARNAGAVDPEVKIMAIAALAWGIACIVGGVMQRLFGSLSLAVRDIARNSFAGK